MSGSTKQGKHAAKTMKQKYGKDYYRNLGRKGAASRKNPYRHFEVLKEADPNALKELSVRGGKSSQRK